MTTRMLVITALLTTAAAAAAAQEPPQPGQRGSVPAASAPRSLLPTPAAPPAPPTPERPRREGQAVNIKVDLVLTDQRGSAAPIKRTLTVLAADSYTGSLRTNSQVIGMPGGVPLNVDATPTLLSDGKIRLAINLQYDWPAPLDNNGMPRGTVTSTSLHDQLMMILENGKAMIVAQSADPIGDRQVSVEVKATILK